MDPSSGEHPVSVVAISGMTFELETPHGRMLAGIVQFERDLISERTKLPLDRTGSRHQKNTILDIMKRSREKSL